MGDEAGLVRGHYAKLGNLVWGTGESGEEDWGPLRRSEPYPTRDEYWGPPLSPRNGGDASSRGCLPRHGDSTATPQLRTRLIAERGKAGGD